MLGTVSAFAYRHRETKKNLCRGGRSQDLPNKNLSDLKTKSVPRSKHSASAIKTNRLMLCRVIIAFCSEIHMKHINTLCGGTERRIVEY